MEDYESTAITSMNKLKEKHQADLEKLAEVIKQNFKQKDVKRSKEIIDLQKQIDTLVSINKFEEADKVKQILEMTKALENSSFDKIVDDTIIKE